MSEGEVLEVLQHAMIVVFKLAAPLLLVSLTLGLIIAIFQAATQIHEQTLTFVPKVLTIGLLLWMLGSWMNATISDYFRYLFEIISGL